MYGAWAFISYTPIDEFLCAIPGEVNISNGWTVGCGNCSDTLMLCDKSDCWRHAFNLTWQLDAATPNGAFYGDFQEAALDSTCNSLVLTADSPASMLTSIEDRRANPSRPQVGQACVSWSCRVLVRATMRSLGTHLTGPGICTNDAPSVKEPWFATECSCDDMLKATSFRSLCGAMSTGLRSAVFERHLSKKDQCYQGNMAASAAINPIEYSEFANDINCESLFENTGSTCMVCAKNYLLANLPDPTSYPIAPYCRKVMCFAFVDTLANAECNFTTNAQLTDVLTATLISEIATECQAENLALTPLSMCALSSFNESSYCEAQFPGRRLDDEISESPWSFLQGVEPFSKALRPNISSDAAVSKETRPKPKPKVQPGNATRKEAVVEFDGMEALAFVEDFADCGGLDSSCSSDRRLQVTPAPATTGALQEYTVTSVVKLYMLYAVCAWSNDEKRLVSGGRYMSGAEAFVSTVLRLQALLGLDVLVFVLATAAAYCATGLIAFLLWLGFVMVAQLEEDDYTEMSCGLKCLGCFCKFLPIVTKIMTYATMLLIIVLVVTALVPIGELYSDCKGSTSFTQLAIGGIVVWVVQLIVGVYMHRNKPMPPWL
eukprot:CAMPEP_0181444390 /NCGR_PEP_ID=MMETSP1110-20121109/25043_1 /TAXON_ID=174948 /ORGANISM="Symbiodinium sp., Strain CCMP421" /LENGTH=604 /DNA_ID=CAMNT_0023568393 /DNA_START=23 /DNA_END=1834 /DNA_ORIENTATION=-